LIPALGARSFDLTLKYDFAEFVSGCCHPTPKNETLPTIPPGFLHRLWMQVRFEFTAMRYSIISMVETEMFFVVDGMDPGREVHDNVVESFPRLRMENFFEKDMQRTFSAAMNCGGFIRRAMEKLELPIWRIIENELFWRVFLSRFRP